MADVLDDFLTRLKKGTSDAHKTYKENPALHHGQKPEIVVVGCSDSRVPTDILFSAKPGDVFTFRNIGGSLEDENDPSQLSADAKKMITYAHHLGVKTLAVIPHGKCGCIANACACANGNAHGHGLEGEILKDMGDKKRFAVDLVEKTEGLAYLEKCGLPSSSNDPHFQAVEIAHGFHQAQLAKEHLQKLGSTMKAVVVYFDVATCDTYVSLEDDQKFMKI